MCVSLIILGIWIVLTSIMDLFFMLDLLNMKEDDEEKGCLQSAQCIVHHAKEFRKPTHPIFVPKGSSSMFKGRQQTRTAPEQKKMRNFETEKRKIRTAILKTVIDDEYGLWLLAKYNCLKMIRAKIVLAMIWLGLCIYTAREKQWRSGEFGANINLFSY